MNLEEVELVSGVTLRAERRKRRDARLRVVPVRDDDVAELLDEARAVGLALDRPPGLAGGRVEDAPDRRREPDAGPQSWRGRGSVGLSSRGKGPAAATERLTELVGVGDQVAVYVDVLGKVVVLGRKVSLPEVHAAESRNRSARQSAWSKGSRLGRGRTQSWAGWCGASRRSPWEARPRERARPASTRWRARSS